MDESGAPVPFSVTTDNIKVSVHGTVFKVIDVADSGRSTVALYDGSVSIATGDAVTELEHGEEYRYNNDTKESDVALISAGEMTGHGFMPLLRFEESTLGNLVESLAANYDVEFVLPLNVDLSRGRFSGDFSEEDLGSTLSILTKSNMTHSFSLVNCKVLVSMKIDPLKS
jgi:ferric-dicitrate binding protein FerR (iron transport regulator)